MNFSDRDVIRFWSYVDQQKEGCWEWKSWFMRVGYGCFDARKKKYGAHRVSYFLRIGPIPDGMCVCHHCDNRKCVRPDHLFLGTKKDNTKDMISKKRGLVGELNGSAKLTEGDVRQIRRQFSVGDTTKRDLARNYGVTEMAVTCLLSRKTWGHVTV